MLLNVCLTKSEISRWLNQKTSCPNCKWSYRAAIEEYEGMLKCIIYLFIYLNILNEKIFYFWGDSPPNPRTHNIIIYNIKFKRIKQTNREDQIYCQLHLHLIPAANQLRLLKCSLSISVSWTVAFSYIGMSITRSTNLARMYVSQFESCPIFFQTISPRAHPQHHLIYSIIGHRVRNMIESNIYH